MVKIIIKSKKPEDPKDKKIRESGDLTQPDEKDKFIKLFGWHPNESGNDTDKYLKRRGLKPEDYPDYGEQNKRNS